MSQKIEYTGSDVTEAISTACRELGVNQDALQIEVVVAGSSGIFGLIGRKKAVIAVTLKSSGRPAKPAKPVERVAGEGVKPSRPRRNERKDDKKDEKRGERKSEGRRSEAPAPRRIPEKPPAEITAEILAAVKADLEKVLELMGFVAQVSVSNEENRIIAKLEGGNEAEIIGPEGQTLDSLQYLMRKIISRRVEGKVMFSVDVGSYREVRRDDLEEMAVKLAEEVRENGRTRSIPALNPAERRIVHMKLQDDPTIRSRSVGEGQFKKILIYLPGRGKKGKSE